MVFIELFLEKFASSHSESISQAVHLLVNLRNKSFVGYLVIVSGRKGSNDILIISSPFAIGLQGVRSLQPFFLISLVSTAGAAAVFSRKHQSR
jgi:hypothetical protein